MVPADEIICTIDWTNVLRWVSPSCATVLGWSPEEMVGRSPECLFLSGDLVALPAAPQLPNRSTRSVTFKARVRRDDGSFLWMTVVAGAVRGERQNADIEIVLVMRAISDHKELRTGVFRPGSFDNVA